MDARDIQHMRINKITIEDLTNYANTNGSPNTTTKKNDNYGRKPTKNDNKTLNL